MLNPEPTFKINTTSIRGDCQSEKVQDMIFFGKVWSDMQTPKKW